ncbi:hypothetical protein BN1723_004097, partial [Verticillium longisporum]
IASTIVGKSGRAYVQGDVLQRHREDPTTLSVFKAEYILTSMPSSRHFAKPFYDLSLRLAAEFTGSRRLRIHVNYNLEEGILEDPDFPLAERKKILRRIAETYDKEGNKTVTDIALGDFNIASKSVTRQPHQISFTIGNVI